MIKVLPIALVPFIFFIFYFNVIFLTEPNLPEIKNKLIEIQSVKPSKFKNDVQNNDNFNEDEQIKKIGSSETLVRPEVQKDFDYVKKVDEKLVKEDYKISKKVKVQFGAFKNEKNIKKLDRKLSKIFKTEFGNDYGTFSIIKSNKHFKLILNTNSVKDAKKICDFSKINKINCLIIN